VYRDEKEGSWGSEKGIRDFVFFCLAFDGEKKMVLDLISADLFLSILPFSHYHQNVTFFSWFFYILKKNKVVYQEKKKMYKYGV